MVRSLLPLPLPNPELHWSPRGAAAPIDDAEVERRIGPFAGRATLLTGGLSNANFLIEQRVLRIYQRDKAAAELEAALLRRHWASFRVPKLLAVGDDFLLLEYVAHLPLLGSAEHGAATGRALAEIHALSFPRAGFIDASLTVTTPFDDLVTALIDYTQSELARAPTSFDATLTGRVLRTLHDNTAALRELAGPPVLLHSDFKASNLHWADDERLLVLDWEFSYVGAALSDIGQLLRWSAPRRFVDAFALAYVDAGGRLPVDFERWAMLFDLVNLAGLLTNLPWTESSSHRVRDVRGRMEATLAAWT